MASRLRVVILKPSKYALDGCVERFRWGFMPNSTLCHIRSMTPSEVDGIPTEIYFVDEYVHTDLNYLSLLKKEKGCQTLLALVGVQSHQFHRALDLAAYAHTNGCLTVIGGPHPMTCDTSMLQDRGVSFALAEAELIWPSILSDAVAGELRPVYGRDQRWDQDLNSPVIVPPSDRDLKRYVVPMLGLYPCAVVRFYATIVQLSKSPVSEFAARASIRRSRASGRLNWLA